MKQKATILGVAQGFKQNVVALPLARPALPEHMSTSLDKSDIIFMILLIAVTINVFSSWLWFLSSVQIQINCNGELSVQQRDANLALVP